MKRKLAMMLLVLLAMTGCGRLTFLKPTPTPLPGWRLVVSELLLDEEALPEGWVRMRDGPENSSTDPTINHVYRSWWNQVGGAGTVTQAIWRSYSLREAEEWYAELRQKQFQPARPSPYDIFVPFETPTEIRFQSEVADEFYLGCGWWGTAYCEVVARYRNYVADLKMDLEATCGEYTTHGLTYEEIEEIIRAMDARFTAFLVEHPLTTPTPQP